MMEVMATGSTKRHKRKWNHMPSPSQFVCLVLVCEDDGWSGKEDTRKGRKEIEIE